MTFINAFLIDDYGAKPENVRPCHAHAGMPIGYVGALCQPYNNDVCRLWRCCGIIMLWDHCVSVGGPEQVEDDG